MNKNYAFMWGANRADWRSVRLAALEIDWGDLRQPALSV
tara:strand:- start:287 stop:403 length:117 start_codon:yes stop_codon:yes gene_type:complete